MSEPITDPKVLKLDYVVDEWAWFDGGADIGLAKIDGDQQVWISRHGTQRGLCVDGRMGIDPRAALAVCCADLGIPMPTIPPTQSEIDEMRNRQIMALAQQQRSEQPRSEQPPIFRPWPSPADIGEIERCRAEIARCELDIVAIPVRELRKRQAMTLGVSVVGLVSAWINPEIQVYTLAMVAMLWLTTVLDLVQFNRRHKKPWEQQP